jgi:anti-sigma B factor antagonist
MELTEHRSGDVIVIDCREENIDAGNVRDFRDSMQRLIGNQGRVVLDMSRVRFVDSSGLGALLSCLRDVNSRKGDLRLCAMSRPVRALFELLRMHRLFSIHDSVDSAIASFL